MKNKNIFLLNKLDESLLTTDMRRLILGGNTYYGIEEFKKSEEQNTANLFVSVNFIEFREIINEEIMKNKHVYIIMFIDNIEHVYLIKNIEFNELENQQFILLHNGNETVRIFHHDIIYIESQRMNIFIHTTAKIIQTRMKLTEVMLLLNNGSFMRVHQSYLVNMRMIQRLKRYEIEMMNGVFIPISKAYTKNVRYIYSAFLTQQDDLL